jgi:hypothetical protein
VNGADGTQAVVGLAPGGTTAVEDAHRQAAVVDTAPVADNAVRITLRGARHHGRLRRD